MSDELRVTSDECVADVVADMRRHIEAARSFPQDIEVTTGDVEGWIERLEDCARNCDRFSSGPEAVGAYHRRLPPRFLRNAEDYDNIHDFAAWLFAAKGGAR